MNPMSHAANPRWTGTVDHGERRPMKWKPVAVAALCAVVVAMAGGLATQTGPWYRDLEKSSLTPPDWVFGPAWTLIYALCVAAAVRGWNAVESSRDRSILISLFFVNAVLNVLWSVAFFTLRRPDWALAEVATLWLSVLALVLFFRARSPGASALLSPYLVWVAFAAYLNFRVVQLNGPFS